MLLERFERPFVLSQSPPDGTSLLRSEVKRKVLLVFVILPNILACFLVGHGEHPGDRLAHGVNLGQLRR